jgi:probable phosphoglycerate mutase
LRLVVVRHGETEWSADGRHTSRTDVALTAHGRRQAEALGPVLAAWSFALVLTSPMARAADTAALAGFGDRATIDQRLCEWDYGAYEGRTTADIRSEVTGWTLWSDGAPGGESPAAVSARAEAVIATARAADGDVLAFSHGHFLRVLAARWVGLEASRGRSLGLATGSISVLGWEREEPVIEQWDLVPMA